MARPEIDNIYDLDQPTVKRAIMSSIGAMGGMYEVKVQPKRNSRSLRANAYYFAAVVTPFFQLLREQEPTVTKRIQAHTELKRQILGTRAVKVGNAVTRIVPTTHDMDVAVFMDYVDRARHWLRERVGIETLDPGECGVQVDYENTSPTSKEAAAV